jgi:CRP/FNR family cyclic AMP-dependent transcriptional regulator
VLYSPRSVIFRQGEPGEHLYLVLDGSVSVVVDDNDQDSEQEMVVSYLNPGDFVGEMGLFGEATRTANLVARTECELAKISYERFHQIRGLFPDLLYALTTQIGVRLRNTTRKLTDLAFVDVAGRIAQTLIDLTQQPDAMTHPAGMQIRVTRQELGRIVGCSREMAGRVLKALSEDGLIEVAGKTIVVLREPQTVVIDDKGNIID